MKDPEPLMTGLQRGCHAADWRRHGDLDSPYVCWCQDLAGMKELLDPFLDGLCRSILIYCLGFTIFNYLICFGDLRIPLNRYDTSPFDLKRTRPCKHNSRKHLRSKAVFFNELEESTEGSPRDEDKFYQAYTCDWFNYLLRMIVFNVAESRIAQIIQNILIDSVEQKISDYSPEPRRFMSEVSLDKLVLGRKAPHISNICVHWSRRSDVLEFSFGLHFSGNTSIQLSGLSGIGSQKFSSKCSITHFRGQVFLRLQQVPSPRMLITISDLPRLELALDYGTKQMCRLSNLLIFMLNSLIMNRIIFPNHQPILFRPEVEDRRKLLFVPVWRSSKTFLRVRLISVSLSSAIIEQSLREAFPISYIISLGTNESRSKEFFTEGNHEIIIDAGHQFSIPPTAVSGEGILDGQNAAAADNVNLSITFVRRKKRKQILAHFSIPLSSIPANILAPLCLHPTEPTFVASAGFGQGQGQGHGSCLLLETYHANDPLQSTHWQLAEHLQSRTDLEQRKQQYLDGYNWQNLKLAWNNFKKARSREEDQFLQECRVQLEHLLISIDLDRIKADPRLMCGAPGIDAGLKTSRRQNCPSPVTQLRKSLEQLAFDLDQAAISSVELATTASTVRQNIYGFDDLLGNHMPKIMQSYEKVKENGDPLIMHMHSHLENGIQSLGHSLGILARSSSRNDKLASALKRNLINSPTFSEIRPTEQRQSSTNDSTDNLVVKAACKQGELAFEGNYYRILVEGEHLAVVSKNGNGAKLDDLFGRLPSGGVASTCSYQSGALFIKDRMIYFESTPYRPMMIFEITELRSCFFSLDYLNRILFSIVEGNREYLVEVGSHSDFDIILKTLLPYQDFNLSLDLDDEDFSWSLYEGDLGHFLCLFTKDRSLTIPFDSDLTPLMEVLPAARRTGSLLLFLHFPKQLSMSRVYSLSSEALNDHIPGNNFTVDSRVVNSDAELEGASFAIRQPLLQDDVVCIRCYLKRSVPVLGRIRFSRAGISFRVHYALSAITRRVFIPIDEVSSMELINKWHSRTLRVMARRTPLTPFDFIQFNLDQVILVDEWTRLNNIKFMK